MVLATELVRPFSDQELVDISLGSSPQGVDGVPHTDRHHVQDVGRIPTPRHVPRPLVQLLQRHRKGGRSVGPLVALGGFAEVVANRRAALPSPSVDLVYLGGSFDEEGLNMEGRRGSSSRPRRRRWPHHRVGLGRWRLER